ncbi:hypothetical protein HMPREF0971_01513 [Segatella oris F0302]|uniref:Uncharacterized protein n=1 Tax=Segatella oris F0302 TaxID=649760 RepID=D1QRA9_9BACT|nr:hypothetical protein HMPREF0971_01513 [Segatella oris F0302]
MVSDNTIFKVSFDDIDLFLKEKALCPLERNKLLFSATKIRLKI